MTVMIWKATKSPGSASGVDLPSFFWAEVRFLMQSIRVIGVPGFQNDADRDRYRRSLSVVRRKTAQGLP